MAQGETKTAQFPPEEGYGPRQDDAVIEVERKLLPDGMEPEIVELSDGISEDDLLWHDEKATEPSLAYLLSRMRYPEFPEPIGVFRAVDRPKYDDELNKQVALAREQKGEGDLNSLFRDGDSWTVE